jgi:hypothetical protein
MSAPAAEAEQATVEVEMPWRRLRITKGALPPMKTFCDMALRIQAAECIDGNPGPTAMTLAECGTPGLSAASESVWQERRSRQHVPGDMHVAGA